MTARKIVRKDERDRTWVQQELKTKRRKRDEEGAPIEPEWRPFYHFCDQRIKSGVKRGWDEDMALNGSVNEWWFLCGEGSVSNQSWQKGDPMINGKRKSYWHEDYEYEDDEEIKTLDDFKKSLDKRMKNAKAAIVTLIGLKMFRGTEHQVLKQIHMTTFHKIADEIWKTRCHRAWDKSFKVKPLKKNKI